jgi:putative transposase
MPQKTNMQLSILDASWGEFALQLQYKLAWAGGEFIKVNPAYTSQRCSCCGQVDARRSRRQTHFACVAYGHDEHADLNAAKNILAAGHAVWPSRKVEGAKACAEDVRRAEVARPEHAASLKREPAEEGAFV